MPLHAVVRSLPHELLIILYRGICLLACLSEMAGHALYGMTPCVGHTGVTFGAENDRPGPSCLRGNLEAVF